MTVIEASSAGVRDMADGSLRITFEFEPRHSKDAYALFGARGTPVAVAALKPASSKPEKAESTVGELCRWAAIRCTEESFRKWVGEVTGAIVTDVGAAEYIRRTCGVESRKEIDTNEQAAERFHKLIRAPYNKWQSGR